MAGVHNLAHMHFGNVLYDIFGTFSWIVFVTLLRCSSCNHSFTVVLAYAYKSVFPVFISPFVLVLGRSRPTPVAE